MNENIDFVIPWVDGDDAEWQKERKKYASDNNSSDNSNIDNRDIRYRDYGTLKYWFRGIEKYAPWVNKIHFITCGHLPDWLNTSHPKLHIVRHEDYMPKGALPTFNSNAIELMIHKIEGLEEKFVLFNDDLFIIKKLNKKDFFKRNLPCNTMTLTAIIPKTSAPGYITRAHNIEIINKYFKFRKCIKKNLFKYLSLKTGRQIFKTLFSFIYRDFPGFFTYHMPNAYLKSTFKEVWSKEEEVLEKTVYCKFRDYKNNINQWIFNYWQFASGNFFQKSYKFGRHIKMTNKKVFDLIEKQKYKILSISDTTEAEDFESLQAQLISSFQKILPEKSGFEL